MKKKHDFETKYNIVKAGEASKAAEKNIKERAAKSRFNELSGEF